MMLRRRNASANVSGGRSGAVQPCEGDPQPPFEDHVSVVGALLAGLARPDIGSVADLVAERAEPLERGLFDDGLVDRYPAALIT